MDTHRDAKFGWGWCNGKRGWSLVGASQRRMELERSGGEKLVLKQYVGFAAGA